MRALAAVRGSVATALGTSARLFFTATKVTLVSKATSSLSGTAAPDHYRRLGLESDATPQEVKAAYRSLVLKCHPDVVPEEERALAETQFRRISESYTILSDPQQRARYDLSRPKKAAPVARAAQQQQQSSKKNKKSEASSVRQQQATATEAAAKGRPSQARAQQASAAANAPGASRRGEASGSGSGSGSVASGRSGARRFVRKDADEAVKSAFDGLTLQQVLFNARRAAKRAAVEEKRKRSAEGQAPTPTEEIRSARASAKTDGEERQRRAMERAAAELAEDVARRVEQKYGTAAQERIRVVDPRKFYASRKQPLPSNEMNFRPFPHMLEQGIPDGVAVKEDPQLGPLTSVSPAHVVEDITVPPPFDITHRSTTPEANLATLHPDLLIPHLAWDRRDRMRERHQMADNEGHLYSYQRPF